MKRFFCILALIAAATASLRAQVDTTGFAQLEEMIREYTTAISSEGIDTKEEECDYLITSVQEPALRQKVALTLFDIYKNSDLMGDESVAIYLWDNWFKDGAVAMADETQFSDARLFCEFNRASQLGNEAPVLQLAARNGKKQGVPEYGKPAIIFFYDTSCAKCKLETSVFPEVLKDWSVPVNFYAVYVGMDAKAWKQWCKSFKIKNPNISIKHYWDPDMSTDLVKSYAVLATPKLFLMKSDGRIIGRRLEVQNLLQLEEFLD